MDPFDPWGTVFLKTQLQYNNASLTTPLQAFYHFFITKGKKNLDEADFHLKI